MLVYVWHIAGYIVDGIKEQGHKNEEIILAAANRIIRLGWQDSMVTVQVETPKMSSRRVAEMFLLLWCRSLKHHHFCIPEIKNPILGFFLIPLVKSFVLIVQRDPQDGFLIASKLTKL